MFGAHETCATSCGIAEGDRSKISFNPHKVVGSGGESTPSNSFADATINKPFMPNPIESIPHTVAQRNVLDGHKSSVRQNKRVVCDAREF
jgi:hypothetical protein